MGLLNVHSVRYHWDFAAISGCRARRLCPERTVFDLKVSHTIHRFFKVELHDIRDEPVRPRQESIRMMESNASSETQSHNPATHGFRKNPETDLHLNDPIPYKGWLPSEEQIRRFCEQLRSEPAWQERYEHRSEWQSESNEEAFSAIPDRVSRRRKITKNDLATPRANPLRP